METKAARDLLMDFLDDEATGNQEETLTKALSAEISVRGMAVEYALLESQLEELLGPTPQRLSPLQIIEKGERRANILNAKDVDELILGVGNEAPPAINESTKEQQRPEEKKKRVGQAQAKPRRANRGRRPAKTKSLSPSLWALAAIVLVGVVAYYIQKKSITPDPVPTPELVEQKKDDTEDNENKTGQPEESNDPILAIKGPGATREGNRITIDKRSVVLLELADGSEAKLYPRSIVTFKEPTDKIRQELDVTQGKIVVNVSKEARIFKVRMGRGELTVLGTKFMVQVPDAATMAAGQPVPARIEVMEGRVKLKNLRGVLEVEKAQEAVVCDTFKPQAISKINAELRGFSAYLSGQLLAKNRKGLLVRLTQIQPDKENRMEKVVRLRERIFWLSLPPEHEEGAFERAYQVLKKTRIMASVKVRTWFRDNKLFFTVPKKEDKEIQREKKQEREQEREEERD